MREHLSVKKNLSIAAVLALAPAALLGLSASATPLETSNTAADEGARRPNLLGRVEFPNSGVTEAQADFVQGVLYLHNFEYEDAASAFRRAQEIDPLFALAFWGEAMTHNHPIWQQQDRDAANAVLARYAPTAAERLEKAPTVRERGYLETLELLLGNLPATAELEKNERDLAYLDAMAKLSAAYPQDHEARSFHSLAILGSAHEGRDFATYMRAAATVMPVWEQNKEHPGAAHYLIHSFDDPVHAPLGLPMARAYSAIAPDAAHAQHMTSHIFVALGLWPDVVEANVAARRAQNESMARKDKRDVVCGHYPYWLHYGYLQQGRLGLADEVMTSCFARASNEPSAGEEWHFAMMRARDAIDRADATLAKRWQVELTEETAARRQRLWVDAWIALEEGDLERAGEVLFLLPETELQRYETEEHAAIEIGQIEAMIRLAQGKADEGLAQLKELAQREAELPFEFGPPALLKPSWELYGEQLLDAGQHQEAKTAFKEQLLRTPRRTSSLLGLARALTKLGDPLARDQWVELMNIWVEAEDGTPGLDEARMALAADPSERPAGEAEPAPGAEPPGPGSR